MEVVEYGFSCVFFACLGDSVFQDQDHDLNVLDQYQHQDFERQKQDATKVLRPSLQDVKTRVSRRPQTKMKNFKPVFLPLPLSYWPASFSCKSITCRPSVAVFITRHAFTIHLCL